MTLIVGIVAILAILVGAAIVVKVLERRPTVVAAAAVPEAAPIAWPQQLLNGEASLEPEARLRLIDDLGLIGAAWCVPLLARAYEEETDATTMRAVLRALNACRDPSARPTLERALSSDDEEARNLAAEGLRRLSETS
jgi:HEAT repeat protein